MTHLQQQTLLAAAQVDNAQMEGCQAEVHRATQDLWTQVTSWHPGTDPYAPHTKWVWDKIAQPESPKDKRQAVWWSDMVVALVLKATLRNLPVDLMLLNANHGVPVLANTVLSQP